VVGIFLMAKMITQLPQMFFEKHSELYRKEEFGGPGSINRFGGFGEVLFTLQVTVVTSVAAAEHFLVCSAMCALLLWASWQFVPPVPIAPLGGHGVRGTRPTPRPARPPEKAGASGGGTLGGRTLADRLVVTVRLVQAYFIFDAQSVYINRWLVLSQFHILYYSFWCLHHLVRTNFCSLRIVLFGMARDVFTEMQIGLSQHLIYDSAGAPVVGHYAEWPDYVGNLTCTDQT
jgi:hypothetical protein